MNKKRMTELYQDFDQILREDADWAAFLYLSGELPESDANCFEDQLAERADLQDALIEATRLTAVVSTSAGRFTSAPGATLGTSDSGRPADPRRHVASFISLAGLLVAVIVAVNWSDSGKDEIDRGTGTVVEANDLIETEMDVLEAWVDIREESDSSDVVEADSDLDLDIPDWMLTAVLLDDELGADVEASGDGLTGSNQAESI